MNNLPMWAKGTITVALLALITLSWSRHLDEAANAATLTHFKSALAVAALARGFNGVISVAQGTEVAVAPVGIGVTLTIGEILDPLNDLVERFSALALLASVSLGLQLTLGQMVISPWLSGALSLSVLVYLVLMWRTQKAQTRTQRRLSRHAARVMGVMVFLRFLLAVTLLTTHFIDQAFLADRQDEAIASLNTASTSIEQLQDRNSKVQVTPDEEGFFDRTSTQIQEFLDTSSQTLDLKAQLAEVQAQVENSVEEIVNLIVIFLLQTLLLPVASLWLCAFVLRAWWRGTAWSSD